MDQMVTSSLVEMLSQPIDIPKRDLAQLLNKECCLELIKMWYQCNPISVKMMSGREFFPLSSLMQILNLDGKDKILPVIQENENYQQQMQQMQQQIEQMGQQMQQVQAENQSLKKTATQMNNALASMKARRRGNGEEQQNPMVSAAQNNFGQQTGMPLPT